MKLTNDQYEILHHTEHRAAGGLYCGGGSEMDELVALGLMSEAGRKSFVPDPYYRITSAGRSALRERARVVAGPAACGKSSMPAILPEAS
jgi:hypothetical protein